MAKTTEKEEGIVLSNPYNEEMVKIKLFKGEGKYSNDVFVARNGMTYLIQRGVEVTVPKGIALILENSEKMDNLAMERIAAATSKSKGVL